MTKKSPKIEVPGEPTAEDAAPVATEDVAQAPAEEAVPEKPASPATAPATQTATAGTAQSDAQKNQALQQQVAETMGQLAEAKKTGRTEALDWSHLTEPAILGPQINPNAADDGLPAYVDPATIPFGQKVLTKSGWVVSTAENPNPRGR